MKENERCQHPDCVYRNSKDPVQTGQCNYLALTGRSRTVGLPERLKLPCFCPYYEPNGKTVTRQEEDWRAQALKLYNAGATDGEIAEALGAPRGRVQKWRSRTLKKPPNRDRMGPETRFDWKRAKTLYKQGWDDIRIAGELECSISSVWRWRNRNGLPPNRRTGKRPKDEAV